MSRQDNNKLLKALSKSMLLFVAAFTLTACHTVQNNQSDFKTEWEVLDEKARIKINQLNSYFDFILDKTNSPQDKNDTIEQALSLFFGEGKEYYDSNDNYVPASLVEISDFNKMTNRVTIKNQTIQSFLYKLNDLSNKEVHITDCDVYYITNVRKIGCKKYEATLSYVPFRLREGRIIYYDRTNKSITVNLDKRTIEKGVLLGNIKVKVQ